MSDNSKHTSKIDISVLSVLSVLRERINAHLKRARAEERHALNSMMEDWEKYDDAFGIEYVFVMGKQEAFESIMKLIDNFSYSNGPLQV